MSQVGIFGYKGTINVIISKGVEVNVKSCWNRFRYN